MRPLALLAFPLFLLFLLNPSETGAGTPDSDVARLSVLYSRNASHTQGKSLAIGEVVRTYAKGSVKAQAWNYGIKELNLSPYSSASVREAGKSARGGRVIKIDLTGNGTVTTRYFISASSRVDVCTYNKGCVSLHSSAQFKSLSGGRVAVGLVEGQGVAQDILEKDAPVVIPAGYYSIMDANGKYSPAQKVNKAGGYRTTHQTQQTHTLQALDGYSIKVGGVEHQTITLHKAIPFAIVTPLDV